MKYKKNFGGEKNLFGGGNPHGLYVPMTETEQEVLHRIVEAKDLEIVVHGWGIIVSRIQASFGDHRIGLTFVLSFDKPEVLTPVSSLNLELRLRSTKKTLLRKDYPLMDNRGKPILVCQNIDLTLVWDIAIDHMSPELVKAIQPGALGLTSRRLDKNTQQRTLLGNMDLNDNKQKILNMVDSQAQAIRQRDIDTMTTITKKSGS